MLCVWRLLSNDETQRIASLQPVYWLAKDTAFQHPCEAEAQKRPILAGVGERGNRPKSRVQC